MTSNPFFTKLILVPVLLPALAWVGFMAEDTPGQNIPSGYSGAALTEDVKTAAEFAVQEQSKRQTATLKLTSIFKAEKQIVAGVNLPVGHYGETRTIRARSESNRVPRLKIPLSAEVLGMAR